MRAEAGYKFRETPSGFNPSPILTGHARVVFLRTESCQLVYPLRNEHVLRAESLEAGSLGIISRAVTPIPFPWSSGKEDCERLRG